MSGRCERVYVRLTPGEKDRALDLASRNSFTVSQLVRVLIQLPMDCVSEGTRTAVVLDRVSAGRLEREMRRWATTTTRPCTRSTASPTTPSAAASGPTRRSGC